MSKELKEKAKILRVQGYSFREISESLLISKSTASLWTRNQKMSSQGKKRFNNLIISSSLKASKNIFDKREKYLKELENNCDVLKNKKRLTKIEAKMFLALLYWCEGSKTERLVNFTNSDPDMISVYLELLRKAFTIKEEKLYAWLHLHDYHDRKESISFWSKITGIDKKLIHVYNKKNTGLRKKEDYKGCISVRYGDYKIFDELMLIIKRFVGCKI